VRHLGEGSAKNVTAHHGSLARELRLAAEQRLKSGELSALVATASLELGIDIGAVDLVIQIGSTRAISTLLQRIGRSNHTVSGFPKGRVFPLSRNEQVECAALLDAVRRGELDRLTIPEQPLDILAQQIVAAVAPEEWTEDALFEMVRGAYPFRNLTRHTFDQVIRMLAEGFATKRGRRSAYLHHDAVNQRLRGRRGIVIGRTNGGIISGRLSGDSRTVGNFCRHPQRRLRRSLAGDIFQLSHLLKSDGSAGKFGYSCARAAAVNSFLAGRSTGTLGGLSEAVSRLKRSR
jgi:ATP-dependent Lhr-like helicase